ncbi:MAG: hypothetical protein QGF59_20660, partial [Pirellulaceae bacterium]|nr:hypothetical protein [Pirellulaceae bacterium]
MANKALCKEHTAKLAHGYVTGSIPFKKLEDFLREERKRQRIAHECLGVQEEGVGASWREKQVGPAKRSKLQWYSRHMMWSHARKLDTAERRRMFGELCSLDDLTDAEYDQCLETVH